MVQSINVDRRPDELLVPGGSACDRRVGPVWFILP